MYNGRLGMMRPPFGLKEKKIFREYLTRASETKSWANFAIPKLIGVGAKNILSYMGPTDYINIPI